MIKYRKATKEDINNIALLHAHSWQVNYAGMFSDDYLSKKINADRMAVWNKRFEKPNDKQHIILAEEGGELVGFICTYFDHDPQWGALLDNLHIATHMKRKGIGMELMRRSAKWVYEKNPDSNYYLWVLADNLPTINFYEKMGGMAIELTPVKMPDGEMLNSIRYVWTNLDVLIR